MMQTFKIANMVFLCLFSLYASSQDVTKTFDVAQGGNLDLDAVFGAIRVKSIPSEQVEIRVVFSDADSNYQEKYKVDFEQNGSYINVKSSFDDDSIWFWQRRKRPRVKFEIKVPEQFNLDLKTSGGSISVTSLSGNVFCKTSGGSIQVDQIMGNVELRTSGGSISLESCQGQAVAKTSGGSIYIGKVRGEVRAHTSGGGISVDEVMGPIDAVTSGGSIRVSITQQPEEDCRLKTSGGTISVAMSSHIALYLDARTSGGHVSSDFDFASSSKNEKHHIIGEINGGGPELILRTSGGNISIRK